MYVHTYTTTMETTKDNTMVYEIKKETKFKHFNTESRGFCCFWGFRFWFFVLQRGAHSVGWSFGRLVVWSVA